MVFKHFFLQNTLMARETPSPLHGKCHFKFLFCFFEPSLIITIKNMQSTGTGIISSIDIQIWRISIWISGVQHKHGLGVRGWTFCTISNFATPALPTPCQGPNAAKTDATLLSIAFDGTFFSRCTNFTEPKRLISSRVQFSTLTFFRYSISIHG